MTKRVSIYIFLAAMGCFVLAFVMYHLGFEFWPPTPKTIDGDTVAAQMSDLDRCIGYRLLSWIHDLSGTRSWEICRANLVRYGASEEFDVRFWVVVGFDLVGAASLFIFALSVQFAQHPPRVVRGPRLQAGRGGLRAFTQACANEYATHGKGAAFVPSSPLGRERETRHFLILGSVGGGKTQTMLHLISEAIARQDGVLVLDTKGDMMGGLPAINNRPLFVAPHDFRSLAWDIAADCSTKQDARELAARFIAPSSDPMWSEAAQEIFVACIVHLQVTQGHGWGWRDLEAVVTADLESLLDFAQTHNPNALRLLSQPDSKTTQGILTTFQTHMRIVSVLADAWPDNFRRRFAIRAWLHGPSPDRLLILQQDPGYPELSRIWIGSMLSLLASAVGSPTLLESSERRVWLFLDEFPQLPVIKQFPTFLELGRSKGIAVVIGAQDTAQIRAAYGADQAKSWFGMIGTKIITRINASEAAEDISRLIGDQEIERRTKSETRADGKVSITESMQHDRRRAVTASELASRLGPTKKGVRVLFVGLGEDVYELELPYIELPRLREPVVPAEWTSPWTASLSLSPEERATFEGLPRRSCLTEELAERIRQTRDRT
jgi:type IV secretion system coupling TraD/TrwB family protein